MKPLTHKFRRLLVEVGEFLCVFEFYILVIFMREKIFFKSIVTFSLNGQKDLNSVLKINRQFESLLRVFVHFYPCLSKISMISRRKNRSFLVYIRWKEWKQTQGWAQSCLSLSWYAVHQVFCDWYTVARGLVRWYVCVNAYISQMWMIGTHTFEIPSIQVPCIRN